MRVRHKKLLNEHIGPKSQSKVLFCTLFLAGKLYHSLSVCSLHDKMGFDSPVPSVWSAGSRRRSEGPGVWQQWCCRAQGTERQPPLSDVSRAFSSSNIGQTFPRPRHADKHNAQACMHCQGGTRAFHCASRVAQIYSNCSRQGQGTPALLCCFFCCCFSENGDLISLLCFLFVSAG